MLFAADTRSAPTWDVLGAAVAAGATSLIAAATDELGDGVPDSAGPPAGCSSGELTDASGAMAPLAGALLGGLASGCPTADAELARVRCGDLLALAPECPDERAELPTVASGVLSRASLAASDPVVAAAAVGPAPCGFAPCRCPLPVPVAVSADTAGPADCEEEVSGESAVAMPIAGSPANERPSTNAAPASPVPFATDIYESPIPLGSWHVTLRDGLCSNDHPPAHQGRAIVNLRTIRPSRVCGPEPPTPRAPVGSAHR